MNIVTGYTGTPHITANEAQALNQGILGSGNYVLDVGQRFSATIVDANNITIEDGEGVMQGVQFRIAPGETENVSIDSGTTGYNRIDLICARYTKDPQTGIEAVNLVVIKGTPTASTPSLPTYNTGDVLLGASPVDFPLYKVTLTGLTPVLTQLFANRTITVTKSESVVATYVGPNAYAAQLDVPVTLPAGTYGVNLYSYFPFASVGPIVDSCEMVLTINGEFVGENVVTGIDAQSSADFVHLDAETTGTVSVKMDIQSSSAPTVNFLVKLKAVRL